MTGHERRLPARTAQTLHRVAQAARALAWICAKRWAGVRSRGVKVLCPACERLAPLERFSLEGEALVVTCSRCGEVTRVTAGEVPEAALAAAAAAPAPRPAMPTGAPTLAPPRVSLASAPEASNVVVLRTAGHEAAQKAALAADEGPFTPPPGVCPKCLAAREGEAPTCRHCGIEFGRFEEATVLPPQWLKDAWVALLRDWGNEQLHAQVRRKAQQADALASVGRLYRIRQAWVPQDPVAEEGRADILRLAAMGIGFKPSREDDDRRRRLVIGLAVAAFFIFLGTLALFVLKRP